nr:putative lipid II flippase FtsW [Ardenticatena sp.]
MAHATAVKPQPERHRARRALWQERRSDYVLLLSVFMLLAIGLLMVYSATYSLGYYNFGDSMFYLKRQALWALVGLGAMTVAWRIDYRVWQRYTIPFMATTLFMLVVLLVLGRSRFGATRWLLNGSVQPSEFAKLTVILYIAHWASSKGERIRDVRVGLIPFAVLLGIICGLILLQPDFSTSLLIGTTAGIMFFVAGADLKQFLSGGAIAVTTLYVIATRAGYRSARLQAFRDPFAYADSVGYQISQTLIALASGGIFGQGLGTSRGDVGILPAGHTDVIFAILGQEMGLVAGLLVLGLFLFFGYRGYRIAATAPDGFGALLACGITTWILLQAAVNVAVVTNTVPFTGIPLPFISFGGSALVTALAGVGLLLSVSRSEAMDDDEASA